MRRAIRFAAASLAVLLTLWAMPGGAQETPERWVGRVAALSGPAGGQSAFITVQADEWTSDATIEQLATALIEEGQKTLLKAISDLPSPGWIKIGQGLRYNMRTMRSFDLPDGTRLIRSVTDRPIQVGEIFRSTRSRQYAFGMVELYLKADGTGEGRIIPAAQIEFDNGQVELTSLGTQPFVIVQVKPENVKGK